MMRVISAAIVGGILLFVWGFLSWVVLPWHTMTSKTLPQQDMVREVLRSTVTEPGVYWIPNMAHDEGASPDDMKLAEDRWMAMHREGPLGMLAYRPAGAEPFDPKTLATGLLIDILGALIGAILLAVATGAKSYLARLAFLILLGLLIGVMADLIAWNFTFHPIDATIVNMADRVVGFGLAGLAMAAIVKPGGGFR